MRPAGGSVLGEQASDSFQSKLDYQPSDMGITWVKSGPVKASGIPLTPTT